MSDKTFFGCMDFRNAKFQGSIRDNSLDGIGIVLDNEFMFALTTWKNQNPDGPSLIIFPNRDYLYGRFINKQLSDICCYVTATGEVYFFHFVNGNSETIVYIDQSSSIIEIDSRGAIRKVKSYIKSKQIDNKWQTISDILRREVTEEYHDYKSFIKANLQRGFNDAIECSENANLMFVGFKNTVSLGAKFDKDDYVKQIGNFEEFPRNIEYGKKFSTVSKREVRVQEGKFTAPEEVYVYRSDKRTPEAMRQTQNYFKKGTNFQNKFLRLNTIVELSKYFGEIKNLVQNLKVFEFGQQILQNQRYESVENDQEGRTKRQYKLQEVKKDIYNAANKRAKFTNRSPSRRQLESNNDYEYEHKSSPRKNSNEKYQYLKEDKSIQAERPFKRSKEKYIYSNQLKEVPLPYVNPLKQTEYVYRYRDIAPDVSQFDRSIERYYRNNLLNEEQLFQQKMINLQLEDLRRQQLLRNYDEPVQASPIFRLYPEQQPFRNRSRSPLRMPQKREDTQKNQKFSYQPKQSKYQNYLQYKNRNKNEEQRQHRQDPQNVTPQKYKIYERKVLGPSNLTPEKYSYADRQSPIQGYQQGAVNPGRNAERLPGRYKKSFKYVQ